MHTEYFSFLKTFKYEFVDCKQGKIKLSIYLMCHCLNLYHVYNNNYNNNYSFVILVIRYTAHNLFVTLCTCSLDLYSADRSLRMKLVFAQGWLNFYWLLVVCLVVPFIVPHNRLRCAFVIYIFHTLTDVVVVLLITSSMYVCVSVALVLYVKWY